jgi:hypothetical protein
MMMMMMMFECVEPRRNDIDRGNPKNAGEEPVPVPLYAPQITHTVLGANPARSSER